MSLSLFSWNSDELPANMALADFLLFYQILMVLKTLVPDVLFI